jgi:hypothetical protein
MDKNKLTKKVGNFQGLPRKEKEREKEKAPKNDIWQEFSGDRKIP